MKVYYSTDNTLEEDEIKLIAHPNNKHITTEIINYLKSALNTLQCYDEYRNIVEIPLVSIYYIELIDHKLYAYTVNKELRVPGISLSEVKKIDKYSYLKQANASTYVNIDHIQSMKLLPGAKRNLFFDNGDIIEVTRTFKDNFKGIVRKGKN